MFDQKIEDDRGVARIVLGSGGLEGFSIAGELLGVDGTEDEEVEAEQGVDQGAAALFEADGDRSSAESFAQLAGPFVEGFGGLFEVEGFDLLGAGRQQCAGMPRVSPIESDAGGEGLEGKFAGVGDVAASFAVRSFHGVCSCNARLKVTKMKETRVPDPAKSLQRPLMRPHLSIRLESRHRPARKSSGNRQWRWGR